MRRGIAPEEKNQFAKALGECLDISSDLHALYEKTGQNIFLTLKAGYEENRIGAFKRIFDKKEKQGDPASQIIGPAGHRAIGEFKYTEDPAELKQFFNALDDDLLKSKAWQDFWNQIEKEHNKDKTSTILINQIQKLMLEAYSFRIISITTAKKLEDSRGTPEQKTIQADIMKKNKLYMRILGERSEAIDEETAKSAFTYLQNEIKKIEKEDKNSAQALKIIEHEIATNNFRLALALRNALNKIEQISPATQVNQITKDLKLVIDDPNTKNIINDPDIVKLAIQAAKQQKEFLEEKKRETPSPTPSAQAESKKSKSKFGTLKGFFSGRQSAALPAAAAPATPKVKETKAASKTPKEEALEAKIMPVLNEYKKKQHANDVRDLKAMFSDESKTYEQKVSAIEDILISIMTEKKGIFAQSWGIDKNKDLKLNKDGTFPPHVWAIIKEKLQKSGHTFFRGLCDALEIVYPPREQEKLEDPRKAFLQVLVESVNFQEQTKKLGVGVGEEQANEKAKEQEDIMRKAGLR